MSDRDRWQNFRTVVRLWLWLYAASVAGLVLSVRFAPDGGAAAAWLFAIPTAPAFAYAWRKWPR